ncbi:MAG TPA: hypothetical protein DCX14_08020 [Flavobacteriales bacterium]|nr:hypothetical protein [Flavobacteriales bacterium]
MKTINNHIFEKSKAIQLTSALSIRQIFRIDLDEYVVASSDLSKIHYRFISAEFSLFMRTIELDVVDLDVVEIKSLCCIEMTIIEVHIFLASRKIMSFRDDGKLRITCGVEMPDGYYDQNWTVAAELFDLPMIEPFDRMMMSENVIREVASFIDKIGAQAVLRRLWLDQNSASKPKDKFELIHTRVNGEFLNFGSQEQACGRVAFLTTIEMHELGCE